jgi:hypothetical protein
MSFYGGTNAAPIPIFSDITNCNLASISWIISDLAWSDHPSYDGTMPALGPSWVADIVNAIGQSYANSSGQCDYWGTSGAGGNVVQPTAIFVTWDDWGGFYDHIQPEVLTGVNNGTQQNPIWSCPQQANQWGCGYTYGFRVPFMVVSEYTGGSGQNGSYISGECGTTGYPSCPNEQYPFVHDFGSILNFTEYNFKLSIIDPLKKGYADNNALDYIAPQPSLSDFFGLYPAAPAVHAGSEQLRSKLL